METVLGVKVIEVQVPTSKTWSNNKSYISDLTTHTKALKQEEIMAKRNQYQEILKLGAKINTTETKKYKVLMK